MNRLIIMRQNKLMQLHSQVYFIIIGPQKPAQRQDPRSLPPVRRLFWVSRPGAENKKPLQLGRGPNLSGADGRNKTAGLQMRPGAQVNTIY